MPKVEAGESREHYMERCLVYPDLQKHDENTRKAICEHLYDRESHEEGTPGEHQDDREEQERTVQGEVYEQSSLIAERIDRDAGILHSVHIMGVHSKHGYDYAIEAQKANAHVWEGFAVGIDHDYSGGPLTVDDTWGTIRGPIVVNEEGTWGELHYVKSHHRTEQLLEAIERSVGKLGLSAVNREVKQQGKTVVSFRPVRLDIVVGPATTEGVFEQAPQGDDSKSLKDEVAALKVEVQTLKAQNAKFEQHFQVKTTFSETIKQATAGVDLTKFWNDK